MAFSSEQAARPYPGYDGKGSYVTPRPAARVKPEAEEFARKNEGSLNLFTSKPQYVYSPRVEPKCPSDESRNNYELGRHGTVSRLLSGSATPRPDSARMPRVKPEAEDIASGHMGKNTANLLRQHGGSSGTPEQPISRIKPEAEQTAKMHTGGRMNCLLHSPGRLPESSRPAPRVKPEAEVMSSLEGMQMNKNLNRYAQGPLSNRPVPRVKSEAGFNYENSKGKAMNNVFGNYGNSPLDEAPAARVKDEGRDNAELDRGSRAARLMHEGNKMRRSPRPLPKATSAAARSIIKANRGQMGKILATQSQKMTVAVPGIRSAHTKTRL